MTVSRFRKRPITLLLVLFSLAYYLPQIAAQTTNQAALVIDYGDGQIQTQCVEFTEDQISGYDLLQRSGLEVAADIQGMGALICGIGGVGCPASDCLCQCSSSSSCVYWSYWRQVNGSWQYSLAGAAISAVTHGTVEGWTWGPGSVNQASPPPDISFAEVCQPPPTATTEPTSTPTPLPVPQISFSVDAATIRAGECTTLRWQTEYIQAVYLNGIGVTGDESREICPQQTETYTLRVIHAAGEEIRTVTVTVLPAAQTETATSTVPATAAPASGVPAATAPPATPTAPATNVPTAVAPSPAAATAAPTSTPTIIWMVLPALPTETAAAITEVTTMPVVEVAVQPTPAPGDAVSAEETAVDWLPYAGFLAIVLGLGALLVFSGRKR